MIAAVLMLITLIHADAAEQIATNCEGKLVFGHGDLIILPKLKDECYIGENGQGDWGTLHETVLAVCRINQHCKVSGLADLCSGTVGCIRFNTIDAVTK